jgi:hypothetical protein
MLAFRGNILLPASGRKNKQSCRLPLQDKFEVLTSSKEYFIFWNFMLYKFNDDSEKRTLSIFRVEATQGTSKKNAIAGYLLGLLL